MNKLLTGFFFLLGTLLTSSQTISLEHDTATNCGSVSINIETAGFPSNVASIQLFVDYDGDVLDYTSNTPGTLFLYTNEISSGRIGMIWASAIGQSINGTLITLHFDYTSGSTDLVFDEAVCVFDDDLLQPITPDYFSGSVAARLADTVYVDDAVGASGDGSSWATALKTIGEATALSLNPGDHVIVKPGTYSESITITSNGAEIASAVPGVVLLDTNKIQFPTGTDLACVDPVSHPGEFYAYVFRSWKSNNGNYKIISVDDALDYVLVEGSAFFPETGSDDTQVMAAVGRPVVYQKDPLSPSFQRVKIDISGVGGATDAMYVGDPISGGATDATAASFNIIDGFDITGGTSAKGLHIQSSSYNVYANGKIYQNNGPGVYVNGNNLRPADFNIIQNNIIYNTPDQGIFIGYTTPAVNNNQAHFNHLIDNEIYQSGTSALAKFDNAILVATRNQSTVIEGNHIRDIKINTANNGALMIGSRTHHTLVYNNKIRNIDKVNLGTHACIMIADSIDSLLVVNNVIKRETYLSNQVFGFGINGSLHNDSRIVFNTVHNVAKGFYLEDLGSAVDVTIQNNIINTGTPYFQNVGTSGRFTFSHNNFPTTPPAPYGGSTGQLIGDPLFVSPGIESANGLMLSLASPGLNTGTVVSDINCDYLSEVRDASPSMGAFENPLITLTWNGNQSNDWDDYMNWDYEVRPSLQLNVIVPTTATDPVIYRDNAACKTIDVDSGATLTISNPFELQVGN